jgi:hypothetical protein
MATAVKPQNMSHRCRGHRALMLLAIGAAAILLLAGIPVAGVATAQTRAERPNPASDPPAATLTPPAPTPPAENPGFVGVLGNWVQQGMTSMSTGIDAMFGAAKGAADAASTVAKGAAGVAKGAADAAVDTAAGVTKLPVPGVASGHEQCLLAANGAPDCRVAAEALCRSRGFATGTSVDFVTSRRTAPPAATRRRASARWNISSPALCANSSVSQWPRLERIALCNRRHGPGADRAADSPAAAAARFLTSTA